MINKKPLIKFSLWFITGLFIMFWGITHPAAASYNYNEFIAQLYDNYGPTLSAVTTNQTNNRWEGTIPDMTAYSSGAAWGISSPVVLIAGHTYSLTAKITGYYGGNIVKSTYDRIGVGDTLNNARISYQNNSNVNELYSSAPQTYGLIQFAFTTNVNGNYIVFPFATSYTGSNQTFWLENIVIDDLGASGVSQSQINTSLNNQTNTLNNSITNSTNTIVDNSNNNRQAIIDNQNANNEALQDTINDNFQTCPDALSFRTATGKAFDNNGNLVDNSSSTYSTNYIQLDSTKKLTLKNFGSTRVGTIIAYDSSYNYIDWWSVLDRTIDFTSVGAKYFKLSYTTSGQLFLGDGECTNKLDEQTDAINGINGSINDDNVDSSSWANFFNNFTTNTFGLTSIVTAPLNLIQSLTNTTCSELQLPLPYLQNKYLTLPCMSTIYSQYFGSFFTLYQTITYGIIAYWVCVRIFNLVKDFKNPDHDEIEVVDL